MGGSWGAELPGSGHAKTGGRRPGMGLLSRRGGDGMDLERPGHDLQAETVG